ncbi:PLP-dependent aminotransferase family protein [Brenneria populi]|uniref:PLP-dependent aminotransferase family protein n=1 Tax=Brenneria populi TaxID=1505588 RepID=A0ABU6JMP5_9GAMM|nr:PLP-dependent aminotransferase family protein [Brenneria populi Li et al. 2015]
MGRGKAAIALDIPRPIALEEGSADKQTAVYEALREAILKGLLKAGEHLPATRALAERWRISRGTVEIVFDRLRLEGYIERKRGSGSAVRAAVPDVLLKAAAPSLAADASAHSSSRGAASPESLTAASLAYDVPFIARMPDPSLLDAKAWRAGLANALGQLTPGELATGRTFGTPDLRRRVAQYLRAYRGISCHAEDVIITTGIRSAAEMAARILLRRGEAVAVEDPGYLWARRILEEAGARLDFVPLDAAGIDVAYLRAYSKAKLAYVTPAHQAPLGITMTAERRLALLDWAVKTNAYIIEDDYDSDFNYHASPLPAIKAIDRIERVIYCGSFNKTLFADLRVAYCVIPRRLRERLSARWEFSGRAAGIIEQAAVAHFIAQGHFARHLRLARQTYQRRRDLLMFSLTQAAGYAPQIGGEQAGFHLILWLPAGTSEADFCDAAARRGISLQPLGMFCHAAVYPPAVLVGYAALTEAKISYAGKTLGALLGRFYGAR